MEQRWNWGVAAGRIPSLFVDAELDPQGDGSVVYTETRYRQYWTEFLGLTSYPFSTTRRIEFSGGVSRISASAERDIYLCDATISLCSYQGRQDAGEDLRDPMNMARASAAFVVDNSSFGFTSPVRGTRYRLELGTTVGNLNFHSVLADYRRYFNPVTELTFAFRGVHLGRYGGGLDSDSQLNEFYLGYESFVRGYSYNSFEFQECTPSGQECLERARLFGHRVGVGNAEIRVPLLGVDRLGLINVSFLPTEFFLFSDIGLAWSDDTWDEVEFEFSRSQTARVPVVSSGAGVRVNVLGFLVVEIFYAKPWQRPEKGSHWGFQIAPGW
jgi:outer membrane protein assembly factor BamA